MIKMNFSGFPVQLLKVSSVQTYRSTCPFYFYHSNLNGNNIPSIGTSNKTRTINFQTKNTFFRCRTSVSEDVEPHFPNTVTEFVMKLHHLATKVRNDYLRSIQITKARESMTLTPGFCVRVQVITVSYILFITVKI